MGGAAGHIQHLHDNRELTFAELEKVLRMLARGSIEGAVEKFDGVNTVFTLADDGLRVARGVKDLRQGGLEPQALVQRYSNPRVRGAFVAAFDVLGRALKGLPAGVARRAFLGGTVWYSVEIIYSDLVNVIDYDGSHLVFHEGPVFRVRDGEVSSVEGEEARCLGSLICRHVEAMQTAVTLKNWRVHGPQFVELQQLCDGTVLNRALERIDDALRTVGISTTSATIGQYLNLWIALDSQRELGCSSGLSLQVASRILTGRPTLPELKRAVMGPMVDRLKDYINDERNLLQRAIRPIEMAVHDLAVHVLRGMKSAFVSDGKASSERLRKRLAAAVDDVTNTGDERSLEKLAKHAAKMPDLDDVVPIEGVVFVWKGNTYKLTGTFAPVNQILRLVSGDSAYQWGG